MLLYLLLFCYFEKENGLLSVRFGIETKEPSPMRIGEAIDEIKALMDTPCPVMSRPQVKQAFMLSIFTYLSSADVLSLKWKDIKTIEGRTTIEVHSRKSSVPLTAVSMRWLPETTNHRGLVFKGLPKGTDIGTISCMLGMTPKTMKGYMKMVAAGHIRDKQQTVHNE